MRAECTDCLVSNDYISVDDGDGGTFAADRVRNKALLGYSSLDIARNYCGADTTAGNEVVAASQLGGKVGVWVRIVGGKDNAATTTNSSSSSSSGGGSPQQQHHIKPNAEFTISLATGTTLAIRPPTLGNYYSKKENDILVALGCPNGAVVLCRTGVLASRPGEGNKIGSGVVGDTSSSASNDDVNVISNSIPGDIVATIGGGHACVMSIAWHPTIPNTFAVGRKDGTIDIYSSTSSDYYDEDLAFKRMHRLVHSSFPIRALSFSQPDGALLFAGDDDGKLYSYDVSVASSQYSTDPTQSTSANASRAMAAPVKLVACALTAHKGWIMNLIPFPDGKRVATCGSDRSVKVWDCGMGLASSTPVHSFDGVHTGLVWGVACGSVVGSTGSGTGIGRMGGGGDRLKLVSCGNDGVMQIFSCSD